MWHVIHVFTRTVTAGAAAGFCLYVIRKVHSASISAPTFTISNTLPAPLGDPVPTGDRTLWPWRPGSPCWWPEDTTAQRSWFSQVWLQPPVNSHCVNVYRSHVFWIFSAAHPALFVGSNYVRETKLAWRLAIILRLKVKFMRKKSKFWD